MLAIVCLLAVVSASHANSAASYFSNGGHCKPICPCIMDDITYDHGDVWTQKGKPCVKYKCFDGFYQPIYQGCEYHDGCKVANATWTEKCMTYRCINSGLYNEYTLIEGGCEDGDGRCHRVGDRVEQDCNVFECQIHITCYRFMPMSKGCQAQGECKKLNSFWHDGCSMFQCVERDNVPNFYLVTNEVMYWPTGHYALLETVGGCPIDIREDWEKGSRFHMGNGHNYVSSSFHLQGNYEEKYFEHSFCSHSQKIDDSLIPRYQTYWDPGRYCIMRLNGKCPDGFKEGYVEMDDLNGFERLSSTTGAVADGYYAKNTGFYFCCRNDGDIDIPIILPKEMPFSLFMESGADDCQTVRGMMYRKEYFAFDDENMDVVLKKEGLIPEVKDCDNNTLIYFCFYSPLDCGCQDKEGNFLKPGAKLKKNCVTYECTNVQNIEYLDVIEGGCSVGHQCKKENETWIETLGERCTVRICQRGTDERGQIIFEIKDIQTGCQDGTTCRDIGYVKSRGCYMSECRRHPSNFEPYFYLKRAGCSDGAGGCIPLGTTFTKKCITYKCSKETTRCGNEFVKGGCTYFGQCYDSGTAFKGRGCSLLQCEMTRNGTSIRLAIKTMVPMCSFKDQCYKIGQEVQDGCFLRRCIANEEGYACHMGLVKGGCKMSDGSCLDVGGTHYDKANCVTYVCNKEQRGNSYTFSRRIQRMGCQYRGNCVSEGDVVKVMCAEYICNVTVKDGGHYTSRIDPYKIACRDMKGNCLAIGETIEENCNTYVCGNDNPAKAPVLKFKAPRCKDNSGVCREVGTEWTDKKNCVVLTCKSVTLPKGKINLRIEPTKVGCMWQGICREPGESWPLGNCLTKTCLVSSSNGRFTKSLQTKASGCKDPSTGQCRSPGEEWNHIFSSGCAKLVCIRCEKGGYKPSVVQYLCKDASGKCRDIGDTGFTVKYRNKYYGGCECKPNGIHARISCNG